MTLKITVTDYDYFSKREFLVEKYPSSISYDGARLNIDGVRTLLVSHDWNVEIEEVDNK